jgi:hypothetical protein
VPLQQRSRSSNSQSFLSVRGWGVTGALVAPDRCIMTMWIPVATLG